MGRRCGSKMPAAREFGEECIRPMIAVPPTLAPFESDFPVRAVTRGPKYHFFGYYDKTCWDGSGRSVLCLEVDFIDRPPTAADSATVGVVDLGGDGRFRPLGRTRAWCWQQSAMPPLATRAARHRTRCRPQPAAGDSLRHPQ